MSFDLDLANGSLRFETAAGSLCGAGFVDHVDRLVGRWRSLMYLADNSAAAVIAPADTLTPWCSSKRDFSPFRISIRLLHCRSITSIFWNRR